MKNILILLAAFLAAFVSAQDIPQDIAKKDLPKLAKCLICVGEGDEKPAGGVTYKGKIYYFCNVKEIAAFKKDPQAYVPPELPRSMPVFSIQDTTGKTWNAEASKESLCLLIIGQLGVVRVKLCSQFLRACMPNTGAKALSY